MQPDRGHNSGGAATVDYAARHHRVSFTLAPFTGSAQGGGVGSLQLNYESTTVYIDPSTQDPTTGLNPTTTESAGTPGVIVGAATSPYYSDVAISTDAEGLAVLRDGSFFVSDEYGPNRTCWSCALV